jgi:O-antigen ligase
MYLKSLEQYHTIFLGLITFVICAFPKMTSLAIILLAIGIILFHLKKKVSWDFNLTSLSLIILYLTYLFGIIFAEDTANGLKYAEYKISLLIIPLLFSIKPNFEFSLKGPVTGLILGTILVSGIGILHSYECYTEHPWLKYCLTSSNISPLHHPSYFSAFLFFAIISAWFGYKQKWFGYNYIFVILYISFALIMYFLCLSMAGIIFLSLFLCGIILNLLYKKFGRNITIITLLIIPYTLYFVISNTPGISNEFKGASTSFRNYVNNPSEFLEKITQEETITGNQVRIVMWSVTTELFIEHPFGVGTGDVDFYINKRLTNYGFHELVKKDLNPHNQYLQTALEIGVVGLFILLFFIGYTLFLSIKHRSLLLFVLITGFAFNSLFESFLQRQSGIVFYAFWIPLILLYHSNQKKMINQK